MEVMDMMRIIRRNLKLKPSDISSGPVIVGKARAYVQNDLEAAILDVPVNLMVFIDTPDGSLIFDMRPDGTYKVHVPGTPGSQWKDQLELDDICQLKWHFGKAR